MAALDGTRRKRRLFVMPELPLDHTPGNGQFVEVCEEVHAAERRTISMTPSHGKCEIFYPAVFAMSHRHICLNSIEYDVVMPISILARL